jgi:hypothetical protein
MSTNGDIIRNALDTLGVTGEGQPMSPEQGAHGLRMLNALMSSWEADGLIQHVPAASLAEEFAFSPDYDLGTAMSLAILLAPHYGKAVPAEVGMISASEYRRMLREAVKLQLKPVTVDRQYGEGNWIPST